MPELSAGVVAAFKKQTNLAVGTILGSNIYNIVGIFAVIIFMNSDSFPSGSNILLINILIMTLITFIFVFKIRFGVGFLNIKPFHLGKRSGLFFLILYAIYIFYNYLKII